MSPARRHRPALPISPPTPAEAGAFLRRQAEGAGLHAYLAQRALELLHHTAGILQRAGGELERALEPPPPRARAASTGRRGRRVKTGA